LQWQECLDLRILDYVVDSIETTPFCTQQEIMGQLKLYFFDTSAIIRMVLDEPGSEKVNAILRSMDSQVFTSWILLSEALGVLKRKFLDKELCVHDYQSIVKKLFRFIEDRSLRPIDVVVENEKAALTTNTFDIVQLSKKYPHLDAADIAQFAAIQNSFLKWFTVKNGIKLVTADGKLAAAAKLEKIDVYKVNNDK